MIRTRSLLLSGSSGDDAALELAVSDALLAIVGSGTRPATLRVFSPPPTLAFGRLDARLPGFGDACEAARHHGFEPVVRSVGGHAAALHRGSVVVELVVGGPQIATGLRARYADQSWRMAAMLARLGADARIGELPGEYCPGEFSVHIGARSKVVGIAQRATTRAALVSAIVVVSDGDAVRAVIGDVYEALGLPLAPETVGAVADTLPDVSVEDVAAAAVAIYGEAYELTPVAYDDELLAAAAPLRERHLIGL